MTRRRTRSANCAFSEMEHAGSSYICSTCKVLFFLRGGNGREWLVQPHPPCTKSDPTWGAEGWRWGGEMGWGGGRPPLHRVDGALLRRRSQCTPRRATADSLALLPPQAQHGAKFEVIALPESWARLLLQQDTGAPRHDLCFTAVPFPARDPAKLEQSCHHLCF